MVLKVAVLESNTFISVLFYEQELNFICLGVVMIKSNLVEIWEREQNSMMLGN